jgi:hypothetical protein
MRIRIKTLAQAAAFGLVLLAAPGTLMSQSLWLPPTDGSSVTIEVLKPDWYYSYATKFTSSVWFLSGQYRVSSELTLSIELPVIYYTAFVGGGT